MNATAEATRTLRLLFLSQAPIGASVMGHAVAETAIVTALERAGIDTRTARTAPWSIAARVAARPLPFLDSWDLDLHVPRWHAVEALRGRRLAREALTQDVDVLLVNSHTLGFGLGKVMRELPTVLSVDTTVWAWHALSIWRSVRPHSRALLRPSIAMERRALEAAALVLAWSDTVARDVERTAPGAHVVTWHPGLEVDRFSPAPRSPRERPRVLFVGGRFHEKGGHELIAALGADWGSVADLEIVSPVELRPTPGITVHRLAPGDPRLIALYQDSDVLCLPSHGDAVPWVVLEALACGTPCVAADVGSIRELLGDGSAGVLVKPGDSGTLGAALRMLLADSDLRLEQGRRGRELVLAHYESRTQATRLGELVRGIVGTS